MGFLTKARTSLNQVKPSIVFLILSLLVGGYIRLSMALSATFPLNDGGLFYQMTQELVANQFRLPFFTGYNHLDIPFAYPPLAFYLTGALNQLLGWSMLDIYRIFPAVITVLTIPAFYLLARDLTDDDNHLSLAVLIFTLLPVTYVWAIMGGGVARSLAYLFALLALHFTIKLFRDMRYKYLAPAAVLLSFSVLSHPETGFHTAVSVPVLWFFMARNKKGALQTGLMALVTLLLTAPWWGSVLAKHGLTPFLAAFSTAEQNGNAFFDLFNFNITDELGVAAIAVLAMFGIFFYLTKKRYFLPVWLLISYVVAPRSAKIFIAPCVAVMAGFTAVLLVQWLDAKKVQKDPQAESEPFMASIYSKILLALLFFQWFSSAMQVTRPYQYIRMTDADRDAFDWINDNTSETSRFVLVTDYFWSGDPVSEWFPALTGRTSVATVQGTEWLGGGLYLQAIKEARELQYCMDHSPACIESWAQEYQKQYDFLYIRKLKIKDARELVYYQSALVELLKTDPAYSMVYESDEVSVFERK